MGNYTRQDSAWNVPTIVFSFTASVAAAVLLPSPVLAAEGFQLSVESQRVNTPAGELIVVKNSDEAYAFSVSIGGRHIFQLREVTSVAIEGVYPDDKSANLILLVMGTGGASCCEFSKLVEVSGTRKVIVTDKFGNGLGLRRVFFGENAWHFEMFGDGNQIWEYRDHRLLGPATAEPYSEADPEWGLRRRFEVAVPDVEERQRLLVKHGSVSEAYKAWLWEGGKQLSPEANAAARGRTVTKD